jgi:hypothetical protein
MTSLFLSVKKKTELFLCIISLAHASMNATDVSIGSINCDPNKADRGRSIIRALLSSEIHFSQDLQM